MALKWIQFSLMSHCALRWRMPMSSDDCLDACERLAQLGLTEVQQREIIREKSYHPYYTLVCQHLTQRSHSYKITLQLCLWDFLRDVGETSVGGVEPVDFTVLKTQTRTFLKELLIKLFIASQVSSPMLTNDAGDYPSMRNRGSLEGIFLKASRIENLGLSVGQRSASSAPVQVAGTSRTRMATSPGENFDRWSTGSITCTSRTLSPRYWMKLVVKNILSIRRFSLKTRRDLKAKRPFHGGFLVTATDYTFGDGEDDARCIRKVSIREIPGPWIVEYFMSGDT
ncbi:hypothetical protein EDB19DRAFT_1837032 [Suillus lakei]|nr:hypothetical protein EDB19DRAFT_1837032 [Suillus lakei]